MHTEKKPRVRASRNCANCRAVKRRCDQQVPHCGQCIRLREKCPGYRDEWELIFHDQTSKTIKRHKAKKANHNNISSTAAGKYVPPSACNYLKPSVDDLGVNYFFHNFVIGGRSNARGCLNYVPTVYHADGEQSALTASMAAIGLVALANSSQRPELASHARVKYLQAIHLVNNALASPVECVKDSTLMSVISLGVFEHVSAYESFTCHVQGAAALVIARGKSQFSSPVGIFMFNQVRKDLVIDSFRNDIPIPEKILELQHEFSDFEYTSSVWWRMGVLSTRCATLLTRTTRNTVQGSIPWSELLEESTELASDFEAIAPLLAAQEPYETVRAFEGNPDIVHNGLFQLYKDSWSIRLWNNQRTLQMVVLEIKLFILATLDKKPSSDDKEYTKLELRRTMYALSHLGDEILYMVPQALDFISSEFEPCPTIGLTSVSGGYMLVWGLFMVGKSASTKSETRKWVIRLLENIGMNSGISVALRLVEAVKQVDRMAS